MVCLLLLDVGCCLTFCGFVGCHVLLMFVIVRCCCLLLASLKNMVFRVVCCSLFVVGWLLH